ncbi:MAG: 50S ribosomal protein L5, partial [Pseudomonadota bacterium]
MADKEKKVDEALEPVTEQVEQVEQVELVGEAAKAEAEAIEALPKVEEAAVPQAAKIAAKPSKTPKDYKPRLKADYDERIVPAMTERFGYKNRMEVPRLEKIVINMGVGEATQDKKKVETA